MEDINILGIGGYGCVFEFLEPKYKGYAGKINLAGTPMWKEDELLDGILRSEAQFLNYQKQILDLDPEEKYFVPIIEIIYMDKNYPPIKKCIQKYIEKHYESNNKRKREPEPIPEKIAVYIQRKVDVAPSVKFWSKEQLNHALTGLKLLHSIGLAHNDVHEGNYGLKKGMPVLIDMDSAWKSNSLEIKSFQSGYSLKTWGSSFQDMVAFKRMLDRAFDKN